MTLTQTIASRNLYLAGLETQYDSGILEFRVGSKPATADLAPTGAVLVTITLPADAFGAPAAAAIAKAGTWQDTSADAAGTAGWWRMRQAGDLGTTNSTDERIDGTITATAGGGDIELDNVVIAATQTVTVNSFSLTQPG